MTVGSLYLSLVILRFLMQWARADFYNPISQFVVKATNPPLKPLRKIIPGLWGLDMAAVVLALLVQYVAMQSVLLVYGVGWFNPANLMVWAAIAVVAAVLKLYFFTILVSIIFSWIAPTSQHPALILLHQINEPVLGPIRRLLPAMGGLDFSPIIVFISLNILEILISNAAVTAGLPRGLTLFI
ncbi:MAG: YggT family protein [Pseudomonadales bacterium]